MSILPRAGRSRSLAPRREFGLILLSLTLVVVLETPGGIEGRPHAQEGPAAQHGAAQHDTRLEEIRQLLKDGRFIDAETRARGLLEESVGTYGASALETALVLDVLVEALWRAGKSGEPETRDLAQRAVVLKEEGLGGEDLSVATSLVNLGIVCSDGGDYAGAETAYRRALAIRMKALGAEHPDVARTLNNLGVVFFHRGEYAAAREQHERALAIREKALGPRHADVATSLSNLALVSGVTGDYAQARPLLERALSIREEALGPEHPYVSTTLSDLASVLFALGDYDEARVFYERSLAVAEKAWNPGHPALARVLNGLAALSMATGEHERARALYERALAIREKTHDPEHADMADSLARLADALWATGDGEGAAALYRRALAIWEKAVGADHPSTADTRQRLGRLLRVRGDAAGAEALFRRALAVREKTLGADSPAVAESLAGLAALWGESGRPAPAMDAALRAEEIGRRHLRLTLRALPERQALRYTAVAPRGLAVALALVGQGGDPASIRPVWDSLVLSRALVLDEMAARNRTAWRVSGSEGAELARSLLRARTRFANLAVRGAEGLEAGRYRRLLDEARREKEDAERALAERSAAFREDLARDQIGLDEVAAALPPEGALVAFVRYQNPGWPVPDHVAEPPPAHYLAFVLPSPATPPLAVPLGPAGEIDDLVRMWRREMESVRKSVGRGAPAAERRHRQTAERLRRKIWDPIEPHVRESGRVYLVPDGALALVSWATLPTGETGYLLDSGSEFHYLSAERDLAARTSAPGTRESLLALGGPDYSQRATAPAGKSVGTGGRSPVTSDRGPTPFCGEFRSLRFTPLPGSRAEAKMVISLWQSAARGGALDVPSTLLVGREATERRFKQEAPGHSVLHLATHAFFVGERCPSALSLDTAPPEDPGLPATAIGDNPLLLSGLVLTDANLGRESAGRGANGEDGVLTAEEIASLDLSAAHWVVLSACGSGLGELRSGEGVLGLRRAFQMAGARSVIMSLWDLDDANTQRWIGALYRSRIRGATTAGAVRAASREILRARREAGLSTHPFFWGGFIAAGEWR